MLTKMKRTCSSFHSSWIGFDPIQAYVSLTNTPLQEHQHDDDDYSNRNSNRLAYEIHIWQGNSASTINKVSTDYFLLVIVENFLQAITLTTAANLNATLSANARLFDGSENFCRRISGRSTLDIMSLDFLSHRQSKSSPTQSSKKHPDVNPTKLIQHFLSSWITSPDQTSAAASAASQSLIIDRGRAAATEALVRQKTVERPLTKSNPLHKGRVMARPSNEVRSPAAATAVINSVIVSPRTVFAKSRVVAALAISPRGVMSRSIPWTDGEQQGIGIPDGINTNGSLQSTEHKLRSDVPSLKENSGYRQPGIASTRPHFVPILSVGTLGHARGRESLDSSIPSPSKRLRYTNINSNESSNENIVLPSLPNIKSSSYNPTSILSSPSSTLPRSLPPNTTSSFCPHTVHFPHDINMNSSRDASTSLTESQPQYNSPIGNTTGNSTNTTSSFTNDSRIVSSITFVSNNHPCLPRPLVVVPGLRLNAIQQQKPTNNDPKSQYSDNPRLDSTQHPRRTIDSYRSASSRVQQFMQSSIPTSYVQTDSIQSPGTLISDMSSCSVTLTDSVGSSYYHQKQPSRKFPEMSRLKLGTIKQQQQPISSTSSSRKKGTTRITSLSSRSPYFETGELNTHSYVSSSRDEFHPATPSDVSMMKDLDGIHHVIKEYCNQMLNIEMSSGKQEDEEEPLLSKGTLLDMYRNICTEVIPGARLFISGSPVSQNYSLLREIGITHIINVAGDTCKNMFPDRFNYLTFVLQVRIE